MKIDIKTAAILLFLIFAALRGGDSPSPGPSPVPDVEPAPFPSSDLAVLVVEETEQRHQLPPSQLNVLTSGILRDYVEESGGEIRVWDQNVDSQYAPEKWREALRKPRDGLPWIYIANGDKGHSGPLPETVEETKYLISKYK